MQHFKPLRSVPARRTPPAPPETGPAGVDPDFWRGRRVFLSGHTGFKGSWLSAWLSGMGASLRGYALAPSPEGVPPGRRPLFDELGLAGAMDHVVGDVRDRTALARALSAFDPEIVFHMAAQPLVRASYKNPVETYETNVLGTVHLLEACRRVPSLRAVIVVTSDKCYENREQIWGYRETDPMGGFDPYSNSKGCAELVTQAWRDSFFPVDRAGDHGVCIASARAGNVIGGGDWSVDRLLPDAMRAMLSGERLVIRNPAASRPWQHVLEPLSGYLTLAQLACERPDAAARGWNFGPDADPTLTVGEVVTKLSDITGGRLSWEVDADPTHPHEARLLRLDCSLARHCLGWAPRFSAWASLKMTADWYCTPDAAGRAALLKTQVTGMLPKLSAVR